MKKKATINRELEEVLQTLRRQSRYHMAVNLVLTVAIVASIFWGVAQLKKELDTDTSVITTVIADSASEVRHDIQYYSH